MTDAAPPRYPDGFLWGVATSAYQVEGALNGPGEPRNNWAAWEDAGRVPRTGPGCRFWERWEDDLDLAQGLGINAFRLGVEWARVEPTATGGFDPAAVARYVDILAGSMRRGLEPVLTLQHFTHPEWLGTDPWLDPTVPARFARFAADLAEALGRGLAERYSLPPPTFYVTVNEPNSLSLATYFLGALPRGRRQRGRRAASRALAGLLSAHLAAYRALHERHHRLGWPAPTVTYNAWACAAYEVDRGLVDRLRPSTRRHRPDLERAFRRGLRGWRDRLLGRVVDRLVDPAAFAALERELGGDEDPLDVIALDYYDPFLTDYLGWRGLRRHPWQWRARPERFLAFVRAYTRGHEDKPLLLLENGIALEGHPGRPATRPDGLTRGAALGAQIDAVDQCLREGLPLAGYFHWSLIDNFEWGSFEPRFGLYGVDYAAGARRLATDSGGEAAGERYRELIAARAP